MVVFFQSGINISNINGLNISKIICNIAIECKSIFDIDNNIDKYIEDSNNEIDNIKQYLISTGIYKNMDNIYHEINAGNLVIKACITYIDPEKCKPEYADQFLVFSLNNRIEYVKKYASCIRYIIENNVVRRYEGFGMFQDYNLFHLYRYEVSDYNCNDTYKIGDIVQFKYPINGCNNGIIIYISSDRIANARTYFIADNNGDIISTWENGELIHHNDIEKIIGQDIPFAIKAIKNFKFFNKEYKEMVENILA